MKQAGGDRWWESLSPAERRRFKQQVAPIVAQVRAAMEPYEAALADLERRWGRRTARRVRTLLRRDFGWFPSQLTITRAVVRRRLTWYRRLAADVERDGELFLLRESAWLWRMIDAYEQRLTTLPRGGRRALPSRIARLTPRELADLARRPDAPWWSDVSRWPSVGDLMARLADVLADAIPAQRRARRQGRPARGHRYAREVLEWTARLFRLRYPFLDLHRLTPAVVKARLIKRR